MDFMVGSRALSHTHCPAHAVLRLHVSRRASSMELTVSDLARTLLRGPRSDVYHMHPSLPHAMPLLRPMRHAALRGAALGLLLQQPV